MKRVVPARPKNPFLRQEVTLKEEMRLMSREQWVTMADSKRLRERMEPRLKRLVRGRILSYAITFPVKALRFVRRRYGGNDIV